MFSTGIIAQREYFETWKVYLYLHGAHQIQNQLRVFGDEPISCSLAIYEKPLTQIKMIKVNEIFLLLRQALLFLPRVVQEIHLVFRPLECSNIIYNFEQFVSIRKNPALSFDGVYVQNCQDVGQFRSILVNIGGSLYKLAIAV